VDDEEIKRTQLSLVLKTNFKNVEISYARSTNSGMRVLMENKYDLVVLDMSMPTFDVDADENGGNPQYYGGSDILYEMDRLNNHTPVIVVTQFDKFGEKNNELTLMELDFQLKEDGLVNYKGAIYYNSGLDEWKSDLIKLVNKLRND
jgi:CheY-like chemotaxis protein